MPANLTYDQLAVLALTASVAGCARGFSGFGGALIFVPIASSVIGPRLAVPLLLIVDLVLTPGLLPKAWRSADRADVGLMAIGAVVGVPAGTYLLTHMDGVSIRWGITGIVVCLLLLLMSGWRYHGRPHGAMTIGVGFTSGLFSGAAQVGGPPVVAYWLGGAIAPQTVRANIVLYFAISSVISVTSYLIAGLITWESVMLSLLIGPTFALGLFAGARLFNRANEATFRRTCYALIACAAVIGLPALDGVFR
ncbi:MAG: sulfite exporter TauE/SafE family protein [Mesorhizobium sp.]|nr:sulfite exporter TauE/SafE family protein [Mesorhizobium sp.]MBL8576741.1 sulfite exporter TauE/SafE family protein [Mesorhizobium sp.]